MKRSEVTILDLLRELHAAGHTILVVTHSQIIKETSRIAAWSWNTGASLESVFRQDS